MYWYVLRTGVRVYVSYTKWDGNYTIPSAKADERNVPTFQSRTEGSYKRLRSEAMTELSPGMRPTSDPLNMIGREAGLMKCRVEYYTGDRVSEKV